MERVALHQLARGEAHVFPATQQQFTERGDVDVHVVAGGHLGSTISEIRHDHTVRPGGVRVPIRR
ncbi:hypothetical protein GCM10011600_27450 [Pseudolysinimonas yzui]|uniref:Uncharacterized protein n=1 Tax=Pseudolysinimonas yzui TaxID=2708254 RepID=A0A8J3M3B7_9MICO|nr:hypothetical protein GCM10011600_27450 [Pseudolysinimonas yzui]